MCLFIQKNKKGFIPNKPYTAKKDLYTLKVAERVTNVGCNSFFNATYQVYNRELTSFLGKHLGTVEEGLHSIINPENIGEASISMYDFDYLRGIILCKIPKGSKYYLGVCGDIVSDKLILIEPIVVACNSYEPLNDTEFVSVGRIGSVVKAFYKAVEICNSYNIKIGL